MIARDLLVAGFRYYYFIISMLAKTTQLRWNVITLEVSHEVFPGQLRHVLF